ncbi:DUF4367 domain-containing protein [Gracilibacillus caseinilyticus]|uniref:DUF4367 domain-containing protein n=1 Tax=Gracilibacillus caseinilyticus TaxID=2932256 RepID=A0ABY4EQK5_9BACI|nr:DUF4367 domain-containing protein [Gracilibacillus caseinilyticus]UOQ46734.1 DUF4367 domain-containing protein [Gracilibacillus caseinilyticus]
MKYWLYTMTAMMTFFLLIGCNAQSAVPEGYYAYEKDKVEQAVQSLNFNPELPSFVPIVADILVTDSFYLKELDNQAFDITIFTNANDIFTIQLINGELEEAEDEFESVALDDSLEGYYQDHSYSKTLKWEKDDITYQIIYRPSESDISKEQLVKVAQSFDAL